jgi:transcriptional regulator with XRE-family HTH domain
MPSLREIRTQQVMSLDDLAGKASVTKKTLIDIENRRKRPQYGTIRKISEALGVNPREVEEFASKLGDVGWRVEESAWFRGELKNAGWDEVGTVQRPHDVCITIRRLHTGNEIQEMVPILVCGEDYTVAATNVLKHISNR